MVTNYLYGLGIEKMIEQSINWTSDTIRVALMNASHSITDASQDTVDFWNDLSSNEITGASATGYTAGGASLDGQTISYDATSREIRLNANDVSWTSSTIQSSHAVIYKDTGNASSSPVLASINFNGNQSSSSGTFTIIWDNTDNSIISFAVTAAP